MRLVSVHAHPYVTDALFDMLPAIDPDCVLCDHPTHPTASDGDSVLMVQSESITVQQLQRITLALRELYSCSFTLGTVSEMLGNQ